MTVASFVSWPLLVPYVVECFTSIVKIRKDDGDMKEVHEERGIQQQIESDIEQ
jgi:hypothetical protein